MSLHRDEPEEALCFVTLGLLHDGDQPSRESYMPARVWPGEYRLVVVVSLFSLVVELQEAVRNGDGVGIGVHCCAGRRQQRLDMGWRAASNGPLKLAHPAGDSSDIPVTDPPTHTLAKSGVSAGEDGLGDPPANRMEDGVVRG